MIERERTRQVLAYLHAPMRLSWCWLDWLTVNGRLHVIFSEPEGSKHPSITNGIEHAIREYHRIADLYGWPEPSDLVYVEHWTEPEVTFDLVKLDGHGKEPEWFHIDEEATWGMAEAMGDLSQRYGVCA